MASLGSEGGVPHAVLPSRIPRDISASANHDRAALLLGSSQLFKICMYQRDHILRPLIAPTAGVYIMHLISSVHVRGRSRGAVARPCQQRQWQLLQPAEPHQGGEERVGQARPVRKRREAGQRGRQRRGAALAAATAIAVAEKGAHSVRRDRCRLFRQLVEKTPPRARVRSRFAKTEDQFMVGAVHRHRARGTRTREGGGVRDEAMAARLPIAERDKKQSG